MPVLCPPWSSSGLMQGSELSGWTLGRYSYEGIDMNHNFADLNSIMWNAYELETNRSKLINHYFPIPEQYNSEDAFVRTSPPLPLAVIFPSFNNRPPGRWHPRPEPSSAGCTKSRLCSAPTFTVESWWSRIRLTWPATGRLKSTRPPRTRASSVGWPSPMPAPIR